MLYVADQHLVSTELFRRQFICNLNACKGACCWEGDMGAPLERDELHILDDIYPKIKHLLTAEGRAAIEKQGTYTIGEEQDGFNHYTTLVDNQPCAYLTYNNDGIAMCGIELAWQQGLIDFRKPISCHLYPIRVSRSDDRAAHFINYDEWSICAAACQLGKEQQMPVFRFLKDPIIRKYGSDFYDELEALYHEWTQMDDDARSRF